MRLSHNSYFIKGDPVKVSIVHCCTIIEADIIDADLNLSHSWRPFDFLYYGKLKDRYLKNFPVDCILYIEFKTTDPKAKKALYHALIESGIKGMILIGGIDRTLIKGREKIMNEFYEEYKNVLQLVKFEDFKKYNKIVSVDLYSKSPLHF